MGQALERKFTATGDRRYYADPEVRDPADRRARVPPRRGCPQDAAAGSGARRHPLFAQAKARGIKALAGHAESVDVTNDVNGGPSGIGVATAAGKAAFWDVAGAAVERTEDHRLRRRVRDDRRSRAGAQDAGAGHEGRQAAPGHDLRQQRRHRRLAHRRRDRREVRRLQPHRAVDLLRLERLRRRQRQRLRPGRHRAQDDGGLGSEGPASDGAHRQDGEGLLAGGGKRQDSRLRRSGGRATRATRTP